MENISPTSLCLCLCLSRALSGSATLSVSVSVSVSVSLSHALSFSLTLCLTHRSRCDSNPLRKILPNLRLSTLLTDHPDGTLTQEAFSLPGLHCSTFSAASHEIRGVWSGFTTSSIAIYIHTITDHVTTPDLRTGIPRKPKDNELQLKYTAVARA